VSQRALAPSPRELTASQEALGLACSRLTEAGTHVELVATTYLPDQQRWLGLCVAPSESAVREAAATAQLTDVTVTEV
jgi:hypothetical protein